MKGGVSKMRLFITLLLTSLIAVSAFTGCGNIADQNKKDDSKNIITLQNQLYEADTIKVPLLPSDIGHIVHITITGELVYFAAQPIDSVTMFTHDVLYTMNIDGTNLTKLHNYTTETPPSNATGGGVSINALFADASGNIWVAETTSYFMLDGVSLFELEVGSNLNDYIQDMGMVHSVRMLDYSGKQLNSFVISELINDNSLSISSFIVDDESNIYIGITSGINSGTLVGVYDKEGNFLFNITTPDKIDNFIQIQNGSIAFKSLRDSSYVLQTLNVKGKTWGESIVLPTNANIIFSGNKDYIFTFSDGRSLYGILKETEEIIRILNFVDNNISLNGIENIAFLIDDSILLIPDIHEPNDNEYNLVLIWFRKVQNIAEPKDIQSSERIQLTLGTLWLSTTIENAVVLFNNNSTTHYIQVVDYSSNTTPEDRSSALAKFSTEITAGKIPDILFLDGMPFESMIIKGLLVDLYPLLDNDHEISRDDFIGNLLNVAENDNILYRLVPSFTISTILGNPLFLGNDQGWDIDEFINVLDLNQQATTPLGPFLDRQSFLALMFYHNMDEYINRSKGTANFTGDDFAKLLEFAYTFPSEADWSIGFHEHREMMISGQQIMEGLQLGDFNVLRTKTSSFGGNIVFKGWPSTNRDGSKFNISHGIAITSTSNDIEGAWDFVKTLFTEEFQREYIHWSFPVNKFVFNERLMEAMEAPASLTDDALSSDIAEQLMSLINTITSTTGHGASEEIWDIVREGAMDFFNDTKEVHEVSRIIQNRVSIFLAEQG